MHNHAKSLLLHFFVKYCLINHKYTYLFSFPFNALICGYLHFEICIVLGCNLKTENHCWSTVDVLRCFDPLLREQTYLGREMTAWWLVLFVSLTLVLFACLSPQIIFLDDGAQSLCTVFGLATQWMWKIALRCSLPGFAWLLHSCFPWTTVLKDE